MTPNRPMPLRSWFALITLVAVGFGIFSLLERLERQAKSEKTLTAQPIDYVFTDVDYSALDSVGKLRVVVRAADMTHDRSAQVLTLRAPRVVRLASATGQQTLSALTAKVFDQGKRVLLQGNVIMHSVSAALPTAPARASDLYIDSLTLLPEERKAFSEDTVRIQQDGATLTGRGLRADFNRQELEINHDVHTIIPAR
jgi:LPS export ABC transporter protein LptC